MLVIDRNEELPKERPAWCGSEDPGQWWMPAETHIILRVMQANPQLWPPKMLAAMIAAHVGTSPWAVLDALGDMERLGLVGHATYEEIDPQWWADHHGEEDCACPRSGLAVTYRGLSWLQAIPPRRKRTLLRWCALVLAWTGAAVALVVFLLWQVQMP